ncbi:unnamed protein product [Leptosia nina]|uniref:Serpin domain-containing protein n=1 Tax=Leptosia nina TaxID=320188 RepID=A0AAV1J8A3_9NEOP
MRLLLVLFLVPYVLCDESNHTIPEQFLQDVFGNPASTVENALPPQSYLQMDLQKTEDVIINRQPIVVNDKFDWTLTKRVAVMSNENFLISPLGLKLALAILMEASSGATKSEISSVLGLDIDYHKVRDSFAELLTSLQTKSSDYILDIGSRIYVGSSIKPPQHFAAVAQRFYKTEITSLDFNKPELAAGSINKWVANITQGRITNLVAPGDVEGVAALVLNTLFFKGTWQHQFDPNETRHNDFYLKANATKEIPFMTIKHKFFYTDSVKYNAKILRMPYKSGKFAMYVVVPNSLTGLPQIFDDVIGLRVELLKMTEHLVNVKIPKFQFEYTSVLDGILKELGIRQAFEDTASFPGISRGQTSASKMKISKVLQRSGIENNEIGSVAYSATEITLENKFGGEEPTATLTANKPFMFFIRDETSQQLLFTGRVSDPSLFDGAFKLP